MKFCTSFLLLFSIANFFGQEKFSIYFDSNKWDLTNLETSRFNDWITQNAKVKIIGVSGFCDEDGTKILNDTLSKKRIDYIFDFIKNKIQFRNDFKSNSFGEIHKLSNVKAENRKVTLFYILPKDFSKEAEIIGIKKNENLILKKSVSKSLKYPKKMLYKNPDGTTIEFKMDTLFMHKFSEAKIGEKLKLNNLNFIINTFGVVNESRGKLYELLYVMEQNSKLKIEIHGHLCCKVADKQNLSTDRAKAIVMFLIYNGIDKSRLSYKGFGGSMPIFSIPEKTEIEALANRRVEILILEN